VISLYKADENYPSAAFPSLLVIAAYLKYVSFLGVSGALHLGTFDQPYKMYLFKILRFTKESIIEKTYSPENLP
jgi:hypothetical protein